MFIAGALIGGAVGLVTGGLVESQSPSKTTEDALVLVAAATVAGALLGAAIAELSAPPLTAYGIPGDIEQPSFDYEITGPPHVY